MDRTPAGWVLDETFETPDGTLRWATFGSGDPVVLVHGTPYSSFLWRDIAPALARTRQVFVLDHLGFGQSEQRAGQDLSLAAHGRTFARLLEHWGLREPSVVAHDIGGAVVLRALLLEGARYRDLTLFDAVSGGAWERGLFQLMLEHPDVFHQLPGYAHEALVTSHLRHATHVGLRPDVLDAYLAPWRGAEGQAAYYRQYSQIRQADTEEYEPLLGGLTLPMRIVWGREDRILPPPYAEWLHTRVPHAELSWVEGAGHLLQEDAPARLLAHLTAGFPTEG
ncbi:MULTISPECIES: alpha/beta hydrolase [unclassified Streptomyces]|uniref:alpha/beta fold hydrolase n=1 Tax=unclassified Streptomyces TaxID=2593676 RepID=UPI002DD840D6|nr:MULTISPECIES: alpha/beta hydrolase [unclassified Streptomyces]WSA92592.1 alpha/beta hydrolase [Streptomyces sp. NBC_01795]WSB76958.1 alpha/beta hydrolase [Streptomyces sp. NBC_01775]WSS14768.1 alpha/beta hydrolase [Streptomyces sp. NBC_01186]WSS43604.1 alpha/beta hydrolase [Streptomyces sp. NBC_01187]